MDPGTTVVLISVGVVGISYFFSRRSSLDSRKKIRIMALMALIVFLAMSLAGEYTQSIAGNGICSRVLGCIQGFFGYDAYEHILGGIATAWIFASLWLLSPRGSFFSDTFWKNVLMLVAFSSLVFVGWEILECVHDYFRIEVLHEQLFIFRLHINYLDQPTNLDTMGDITFSLAGSIIEN